MDIRCNYTIYCHINKVNGKTYVGITSSSPELRWKNGEGYKNCRKFYNAILKYGWDNFYHIILRDNNPEELNRRVVLIKDRFSPIGQFNNTELIRTFSSTKEAEQATGVKASYIRRCLRGERNLAGGFVWKKIEY